MKNILNISKAVRCKTEVAKNQYNFSFKHFQTSNLESSHNQERCRIITSTALLKELHWFIKLLLSLTDAPNRRNAGISTDCPRFAWPFELDFCCFQSYQINESYESWWILTSFHFSVGLFIPLQSLLKEFCMNHRNVCECNSQDDKLMSAWFLHKYQAELIGDPSFIQALETYQHISTNQNSVPDETHTPMVPIQSQRKLHHVWLDLF